MTKRTLEQTQKIHKLNSSQILKLKLIFKFRFVTAELLAKHRYLTTSVATNESLRILLDKGYIDRFYDKSYKLRGKPAVYYLTKQGLRYLRQNTDFSKRAIHAMYKNPNVSEAFVQHSLDTFAIYLRLRSIHPNIYQVFSRSECLSDDFLAELNSDLYLQRKRFLNSKHNSLALFNLANTQYFFVKQRLNLHIKLIAVLIHI